MRLESASLDGSRAYATSIDGGGARRDVGDELAKIGKLRPDLPTFDSGSLLLIVPGILTDILGVIFIARFFLRRGSNPQSSDESNSIDVEFDVRDDNQTE